MKENTTWLQLDSGIRMVHSQFKDSDVVHCGFYIEVGSRDELLNENGIAHFIEHCYFKGTKKRDTIAILNAVDSYGGELNAYTTKEETVLYATLPKFIFKDAVDVLADILFQSQFPTKEINKEKDIVIDEIYSYLDSPSEQIFDDYENLVFKNHSLGRLILGTEESVKGFKKQDILKFIKENYAKDKIIFSYVGPHDIEEVKSVLESYNEFWNELPDHSQRNRVEFTDYIARHEISDKETHQYHCMLGGIAPGFEDDDRRQMILLNNVLGGPSLNNRLNINIREKFGHTYNIESNFTQFQHVGYFSIYFGTDGKYYEQVLKLVHQELDKLSQNAFTTPELESIKLQLKGQIAVAQESRSAWMINQAKSLSVFGKIASIDEVYQEVDQITTQDLLNCAQKYFDPKSFSSLLFK